MLTRSVLAFGSAPRAASARALVPCQRQVAVPRPRDPPKSRRSGQGDDTMRALDAALMSASMAYVTPRTQGKASTSVALAAAILGVVIGTSLAVGVASPVVFKLAHN